MNKKDIPRHVGDLWIEYIDHNGICQTRLVKSIIRPNDFDIILSECDSN